MGFATLLSVGHEPWSVFPEITATVYVDTEAGVAGDLVIDDFSVTEDGVPQTIDSLTSVESAGGVVDIVFVFDDTGSMADEIYVMKSKASSFATEIIDAGLDAQFGLVSFKDDATVELPLTSDVAAYQAAVDRLYAEGGDDTPEVSLDGVMLGITSMDFRADAQRLFVVITDASTHYRGDGSRFSDYTLPEVVNAVNGIGAAVFVISPDLYEKAPPQLQDNNGKMVTLSKADAADYDLRVLAEETAGLWQDIDSSDFSLILDEIETLVTSYYTLTYHAANDLIDNTTRLVEITVNDPVAGNASDSGTYYIGAPVCPITWDVYWGADNPPTTLLAADLEDPSVMPGLLTEESVYYWQVIAKSDQGENRQRYLAL